MGCIWSNFVFVGNEVVSYRDASELIGKVRYYLAHDEELERIALNGFRRARKVYRIAGLLIKVGNLIKEGIKQ